MATALSLPIVAAAALMMPLPPAAAHTLPISYLLLVADADYVHVELTFNPFELPQFPEADTNANRRLDPGEIEADGERLARVVLEHLTLRVGGREIAVETAGLSADPDSHHVTLRAHYRVAVGEARISLESRLPQVLGSSHLTLVRCVRGGDAAFAQLDSRSPRAAFPPDPPAVETRRPRRSNSNPATDP
ncbi:MAG: hypothetical protein N3I86_01295 [Verrucomicrobiae bacterium]|nr:hypothetical protein [Verrucomicrobiae bacterium]